MAAHTSISVVGADTSAGHLAKKNANKHYETFLARAAHKSKREIEELAAELSPRPDVPAMMRKLPKPRTKVESVTAPQLGPDRVVPAKAAVQVSG